jgi:hypothetical protein
MDRDLNYLLEILRMLNDVYIIAENNGDDAIKDSIELAMRATIYQLYDMLIMQAKNIH